MWNSVVLLGPAPACAASQVVEREAGEQVAVPAAGVLVRVHVGRRHGAVDRVHRRGGAGAAREVDELGRVVRVVVMIRGHVVTV